MRKIILFVFFLILNGCSFTSLFVGGEIDKVTVVKYVPYMKHHRAYFARTQLKTIRGGKKYLYLYNAKTNDVGVLLHRKNQYILYNMSNPKIKALAVNVNSKQKYWQALKTFNRKGFKPIKSLASVGHIASVSRRRYKGVKTLQVETKEYSQIQSLYKNAIKNYNAEKVKRLKTTLPKGLISTYYSKYKKRANTRAQLLELKKIANQLGLNAPKIPKQAKKKHPIKNVPIQIKKEHAKISLVHEETVQKEIVKQATIKIQPPVKHYNYYLKHARLHELSSYMDKRDTKHTLSSYQYHRLSRKKFNLEERKLLKHGSLEELIAAYKVNKKEKFKRRIMSLMKVKQTQN